MHDEHSMQEKNPMHAHKNLLFRVVSPNNFIPILLNKHESDYCFPRIIFTKVLMMDSIKEKEERIDQHTYSL